jgi:hypothetical protein
MQHWHPAACVAAVARSAPEFGNTGSSLSLSGDSSPANYVRVGRPCQCVHRHGDTWLRVRVRVRVHGGTVTVTPPPGPGPSRLHGSERNAAGARAVPVNAQVSTKVRPRTRITRPKSEATCMHESHNLKAA